MKHSRHGIGCAMRCAWLKKKRVTGHGMGLDFFGRARIGETRSRFGSWVVLSWRAPEIERPSKNGREILVSFSLIRRWVSLESRPKTVQEFGLKIDGSKHPRWHCHCISPLWNSTRFLNIKTLREELAWTKHGMMFSYFVWIVPFFLGCPTLQQFLLFVFSRKNKELTKNQVQKNGVTKQGPNTATPFLVCSSCDEVELPCPGEEGGIDLAMTVFKWEQGN